MFVGGLGVFTGLVILSFYSVIAGWTLSYIVKTVAGTFGPGADTEAIFAEVAGRPVSAIGWHLAFMAITIYVVLGGVRDGIERWTKVLMPVLFVLLALLAVRAVTLSGAEAAAGRLALERLRQKGVEATSDERLIMLAPSPSTTVTDIWKV